MSLHHSKHRRLIEVDSQCPCQLLLAGIESYLHVSQNKIEKLTVICIKIA